METLQFKNHATRFRKNAKKLGLGFPLPTLLDIYAYAHYGRPYCVCLLYTSPDALDPMLSLARRTADRTVPQMWPGAPGRIQARPTLDAVRL